jgi:hypothetical protein
MTLVAVGVAVGAAARGRAKWLHWGATSDELRAAVPGDELVVDADLVATRAITINRGPDAVWPWLAQLGQGRGGLYSYDYLENLIGCDIHSADRIVPAWQHVEVGDEIRLAPKAALVVAEANLGQALVLRGSLPIGGAAPPFDFSWAFVLRAGNDQTTRLVVRERYRYLRWWVPLLVEPVQLVSFAMSQKMLRGIRDRAEASTARVECVSVDQPSWREQAPRISSAQ